MITEIILTPYDSKWPMDYINEVRLITDKLKVAEVVDIQHFGSTAVFGLTAKPIIDILVGFKAFEYAEKNLAALLDLDYVYVDSVSVPGGRLFSKKNSGSFHLHFVEFGTDYWNKPLKFRDLLRSNQKMQNEYSELKKLNSEVFRYDRIGYTNAKTDFVANCLRSDE